MSSPVHPHYPASLVDHADRADVERDHENPGHTPQARNAAATCDEILADLTVEIGAARRAVNARAVPVVAMEQVRREGPYLLYHLLFSAPLPRLRYEQVVLLDVGEDTPWPMQVYETADRTLTVASTRELPDPLPSQAQLLIDDVWLLERMRDRFRGVRASLAMKAAPMSFNCELAELAVGRGDLAANRVAVPAVPGADLLDALNEEQQQAVHAAMRQRVLYLWGPPGTGKTFTVAAIVQAHVARGRRVLVTAPSNAAADVIALEIAGRLQEHPAFQEGYLLRVGPRPTAALRERYGPNVIPQVVAERLAQESCAAARAALERELSISRDARHRGRVRERLGQLDRDEFELEQRHLRELLDRCGVLVTPIQGVYLSRQLKGRFDVLIVDEASMMGSAMLYLAVGLFAREQVVIAGDFMQLPSPIAHPRPWEVEWLAADPFSQVGIPTDVEREDDPPYLVMLTQQYRMPKIVAELVSAMSYYGRLRTAPCVARRPSPPWAPGYGSLVLVDSTEEGPRAIIGTGSRSRENPIHARIVARLVSSLTDRAGGSNPGTLLVVSPYRRQVEHLRDALHPVAVHASAEIRVTTVHGGQGSEADTVIVSLDDAPGAPLGQFMAARTPTEAGARLLNVALSRTRGRAIVLAPVEYLMGVGGPMVRRFLNELRERGQVIGPRDF